jgi:hypothetical protein
MFLFYLFPLTYVKIRFIFWAVEHKITIQNRLAKN